jgi:hypothetical protein
MSTIATVKFGVVVRNPLLSATVTVTFTPSKPAS